MVPSSSYRALPKPEGYAFQNRFVGRYLIYGTGSGWGSRRRMLRSGTCFVDWARGNSHQLKLPHGVDRIEQMGADAVVVGALTVKTCTSALRLGQWPEIVSRYTRKEASQGELRSHGFFYKPEGDGSGMLGFRSACRVERVTGTCLKIQPRSCFCETTRYSFSEIGELGSQPERAIDDQCRASCVDWYGNARPLFLRGRVFALLGYEIVEGRLDDGRMHELQRSELRAAWLRFFTPLRKES